VVWISNVSYQGKATIKGMFRMTALARFRPISLLSVRQARQTF